MPRWRSSALSDCDSRLPAITAASLGRMSLGGWASNRSAQRRASARSCLIGPPCDSIEMSLTIASGLPSSAARRGACSASARGIRSGLSRWRSQELKSLNKASIASVSFCAIAERSNGIDSSRLFTQRASAILIFGSSGLAA